VSSPAPGATDPVGDGTDDAPADPAASEQVVRTVYRPDRALDLAATLGPLRRGSADPTCCVRDGVWFRAVRTPAGPGSQAVWRHGDGTVAAAAFGAGATWLTEALPALLGARDDSRAQFRPTHPALAAAARAHAGWALGRTDRVLEAAVPAVLEQKVTGREARRSFAVLVRALGEPAPGPVPAGLTLPPTPARWASVASWTLHAAGVGPQRSATLVRLASRAAALERAGAGGQLGVLATVPGVGPWTVAEVSQRALGDPDAVSVGDAHVPAAVVFALTGRGGGDDAAMAEVLAPYAGHRYRVQRLVELAGLGPPRRGPRYAGLDHRRR